MSKENQIEVIVGALKDFGFDVEDLPGMIAQKLTEDHIDDLHGVVQGLLDKTNIDEEITGVFNSIQSVLGGEKK